MSILPNKSSGNVLEGIWFVFRDGPNFVRFWGSVVTGKQKLYLNDTLIVEQRSLRNEDSYVFRDGNIEYEIKYQAKSSVKGVLTCYLLKNSVTHGVLVCKYSKGYKYQLSRLLSFFLLGTSSVLLAIYFQIADEYILLLLILIALSFFISGLMVQFIIEER